EDDDRRQRHLAVLVGAEEAGEQERAPDAEDARSGAGGDGPQRALDGATGEARRARITPRRLRLGSVSHARVFSGEAGVRATPSGTSARLGPRLFYRAWTPKPGLGGLDTHLPRCRRPRRTIRVVDTLS